MATLDDKFACWTDDQKLTFLEILSHQLTIATRCIGFDERISDERKTKLIRLLNEIHHRVPMRARAVRLHDPDWKGPDMGLPFEHYFSHEPAIRSVVEYAVAQSVRQAEERSE